MVSAELAPFQIRIGHRVPDRYVDAICNRNYVVLPTPQKLFKTAAKLRSQNLLGVTTADYSNLVGTCNAGMEEIHAVPMHQTGVVPQIRIDANLLRDGCVEPALKGHVVQRQDRADVLRPQLPQHKGCEGRMPVVRVQDVEARHAWKACCPTRGCVRQSGKPDGII